ncbi:hypothetical protein AMTR_s00043p00232110 [Amborella trichopoda]|uniref:Uncharacterized protein n=1 Tax=Amborella trichopoda TaxID=13333 RepID=W1PX69_AMBTC|nr:hypothetical protein AMTR_s00043p00232110 [Amborella trichopoda]
MKARLRRLRREMRKVRVRREMMKARPRRDMRGEQRAEMTIAETYKFKLCQPYGSNQDSICDHEEREMSRRKGLERNPLEREMYVHLRA